MIEFSLLAKHLRPRFLQKRTQRYDYQALFNYRNVWLVAVILLTLSALAPMTLLLLVNYDLAHKAIKTENHLRIIRLTSNARRTITFFLEERLDALRFIIQEESFERLNDADGLADILENLKMGFGGFVDIGLVDESGVQVKYVGPFDLEGKNYKDQEWYMECVENGVYISDVFLGYRKLPHMIIAVRCGEGKDSCHILRATLDIKRFVKILASLELSRQSDAFICNREGLLQTPSLYYGGFLGKMELSVPPYSVHSKVMESVDKSGRPILMGYAYIENSPYILMLIKRTEEVMQGWYSLRGKMIGLFCVSGVGILLVILAVSTYMVNKIYDAEQTRARTMEQMEHTSRLASVGRLAAGVAHEINNPLAIVNENAGLIKDLFILKKDYQTDQRLMTLIDDILESVERCGDITKNLLGFARQAKHRNHPVRLASVIEEVLSFLKKEASYRNIHLNIDIAEDIPDIISDRGKLQQVFLNLINNAFQAMNNGGHLDIVVRQPEKARVTISIRDDGCGIPEDHLKMVFEPFFSTKEGKGGTGLGLSITYGLVKSLHGDISVQSKVGEGTTFTVILPLKL
jgi:signal transduction histidine kinase